MSALEIVGLKKSFGGLPALADVALSVAEGERRLLIGPNGAGKTTLFNAITGEIAPDAGEIRMFGNDVSRLPVPRRVALGLGRTYQIITLFPKDTLVANVILSLLGRKRLRWNMFATLSRRGDLRETACDTLAKVGLEPKRDLPVHALSYGEKRRLEIAMALAQAPRLLLLDEPLAGLSQDERLSVQALLASIPRDVTIVMIEHDMDVALSFAERITVLHYGKVIVEGTRSEVVADARTKEVYLGQ